MEALRIPVDELQHVAHEFRTASQESQAMLARLEKVTSDLEEQWGGATQQAFYSHYKQWQMQMQLYAALLQSIALELETLADGFLSADRGEADPDEGEG